MSGRSAKRKGDRVEREIVDLHRAIGLDARRVPLSGSVAEYPGDVIVELPDGPLQLECKARRDGFATLRAWLGSSDALVIRPDRDEPYVVLPWRTWARVVGASPPVSADPPEE